MDKANKHLPPFCESVLMLLLGAVSSGYTPQSIQLYKLIRHAWDTTHDVLLPSFALKGLNRVWSGAQTMHGGLAPGLNGHMDWVAQGNPDECVGCKRPRPADSHTNQRWRGWLTQCRCQRCYNLNFHSFEINFHPLGQLPVTWTLIRQCEAGY